MSFSLLFVRALSTTGGPFTLNGLTGGLQLLRVVRVRVVPIITLTRPRRLLTVLSGLTPRSAVIRGNVNALLCRNAGFTNFNVRHRRLVRVVPALIMLRYRLLTI